MPKNLLKKVFAMTPVSLLWAIVGDTYLPFCIRAFAVSSFIFVHTFCNDVLYGIGDSTFNLPVRRMVYIKSRFRDFFIAGAVAHAAGAVEGLLFCVLAGREAELYRVVPSALCAFALFLFMMSAVSEIILGWRGNTRACALLSYLAISALAYPACRAAVGFSEAVLRVAVCSAIYRSAEEICLMKFP